jgi:hypothetical protein
LKKLNPHKQALLLKPSRKKPSFWNPFAETEHGIAKKPSSHLFLRLPSSPSTFLLKGILATSILNSLIGEFDFMLFYHLI